MVDAACRGLDVEFVLTRALTRREPRAETRAVVEAAHARCPVRDECKCFAGDRASVGWWAGRWRRGDDVCAPELATN
jgi:hypothetical protein